MNPAIGAFIGVSKQTEMLLMTVLALWVNIFDMAIFEISSNLDQVWNVEIDKEIFNPNAEYIIRMLLSGVVLIRTFTLHLYIAFLIAVFWPVCFGTRPTLMLPWLVVSAIKNLGTGLVSIGTGGYTCMIYGPLRPACLRFLLSQIIDLSPSFYMWFVGLSLYCDLKKPKSVNKLQVKAMEDQELNMALRRRKVKSMIDEDILRQQFESRSFQKKFLGTSAVEVNEFINRCSYDNLKNKFSRSLDSLLDVLNVQTELLDIEDSEPLDIDSSSTLQQKTAKLLGISMDEIDRIKQSRQTRTDFPAYPVQPQKKTPTISILNSRYESPAKLLPETSLYSPPNVKPIRVTKSELKSAKDFSKVESEFMQSVPEKEVQIHDLTQNESFESLTKMQTQMQMVYQATCSSFNEADVANDTDNMENANISSKITTSDTKESGKEFCKKNPNKCSRKQDRGKLEDVEIEIPTKYKFFNTMSDKSHYLLDEHCFLFDKESMLRKKEASKVVSGYAKRKRSLDQRNQNQQNASEEKQRRLNAPATNPVANTNTRFKDNVIKKTPLVAKIENKNSKPSLRKTKEDFVNKKILKQSEKTQAIKKKIATTKKMPSSGYSSIPVLHRNVKSKNGYFNLDKNKASTNNKKSVNQDNKLYTIEESKDIASVNSRSNQEKKCNLNVSNKIIEENKLIKNVKEKKLSSILSNQEEKNKNKNTILKKEEAAETKISVAAEIERINQKNLKISSEKALLKIAENISNASTADKIDIINKKNYLRSMEFGIPVPFLSIKHSPIRMTPSQKEAIRKEQKLLPKEENKSLFSNKAPQALSEKLLQIIKEKAKSKAEKISVEDIFKEKVNKTEPFKTINNNEFEFTARINEMDPYLPAKTSFRNKQLEFHFKEKITKTKDNKMEDLFRKKSISERKESKTSDKEKLGFPSYFSNKINRMITDACQIRKKSCKKINLFIKVPLNTSSKQRNKLSTIELFRKQSPPKTNIFDITGKLSIGKLEIPPFKGDKSKDRATNLNKTKQVPNRTEVNLFNTEEVKSQKPMENLFSSHKSTSILKMNSVSKTSAQSDDKTINKTDEVQAISKETNNLSEDTRNTFSLINSFMSFNTNENSCIKKLNTSSKINKDELDCLTKTNFSTSTKAETKETEVTLPFAERDRVIDIECVKKTKSPHKINLFNQKSNISITAQKPSLPTISENRSCRKLSEQAMSVTKIDYSTEANEPNNNGAEVDSASCFDTLVKHASCKRLSEQAIKKIISLTNDNSKFSNKDLSTYITESKLNASKVNETTNCKKLSDFAINKLLAITSPKSTSKTSNIIISETKIENIDEKIEEKNVSLSKKHSGIPINVIKSGTINKCIPDSSSKENLKVCTRVSTPPEKSNNLQSPKESKTKIHRKSSIPIIKIDNTICQKSPNTITSTSKIDSIEIEPYIPISDVKYSKSHIIALVEGAINTKSTCEMRENYAEAAEHNNLLIIDTKMNECNEASEPDSPIKIETLNEPHTSPVDLKQQRLDENCKWMSQDSINIFASNTTKTQLNEIVVTTTEENQIIPNAEEESPRIELIQTAYIKSEEKMCNWSPQYCIEVTPTNNSELVQDKNPIFKKEELNAKENLKIVSPNTTDASLTYEENNCNNENDVDIPVSKVVKNCKGTSQHHIELISSTDINNAFKINTPATNEEEVNTSGSKIEKECKGTSQHLIKLITSADTNNNVKKNISATNKEKTNEISENSKNICKEYNISAPKIEKLCIASFQHHIKLITSADTNSAFKTNEEKNYEMSQNFPLSKVEKECKGTSQHHIKLISSADPNNTTNEAKSNESNNEYQSNIPVSKVEKECRGTSQHHIKLISSADINNDFKTNISAKNLEENKISQSSNNNFQEDIPVSKIEKECKGTSQHCIKLISSADTNNAFKNQIPITNEEKNNNNEYQTTQIEKECLDNSQPYIELITYLTDTNNIFATNEERNYENNNEYQVNILVSKVEKECKGTSQHDIKLISSADTNNTFNDSATNEENNTEISQNSNEETPEVIPVIKVEKECKGTSQHHIKLISAADTNIEKISNNTEENINENHTNVITIKHEHEGSLKGNNTVLSSLIYNSANNSSLPLKETKLCKGTSQHNIKLISSIKPESSSEINLCHNKKLLSQTKDDLCLPAKEQKVCRASSQNYVKLIAQSNEEFASNATISHKQALSNILKEYQAIPIMKEEKVCKGTSKHKIKLVSSYKKDSPNKVNLFHTETEYKNNKNENITIIKEEKICEGTLQHSIKLISSTKNDSPNKTIFIVKEQLPKGNEAIPVTKENCTDKIQKSSTPKRPTISTNLFVNVNTVNGKQNFTVIQKQNDDKETSQSSSKNEVNLFVKDKMINTDESNINNVEENSFKEDNDLETLRKITLISNTIQGFFESDTKKLNKTDTNLLPTKNVNNVHPLVDIKSSEILSSLIDKVETSIKLQDLNKGDLYDERCPKYHDNQVDFGCQTSTLSKKILENNPNEITKKLSRTKSITKTSAKSYQNLNLQKLAFATSKNSNSKLDTKTNNDNLSKDEKKDSAVIINSRSSRNASYVSIHKERLEKAKSSEPDLNKSVILQKCAFFEDGYTRLYNLLGVKQENLDMKTHKNVESSFNF